MELAQLAAFAATAELKNMTKAAQKLNLSLSALSTQIKLLEEELNVTLFSRQARGVELTQEGAALLESAIAVNDTVQSIKRQAMRMQKEIKGSITIGVNTNPVFLRVQSINAAILKCLPEISLRFALSESGKTPQMLRSGELDLGFSYGRYAEKDIHTIDIFPVQICMVVSKGILETAENVSWNTLAEIPWVWGSEDCPFRTELIKSLPDIKNPKKIIVASDEYLMIELVKTGSGVCVLREDDAVWLAEQGYVDILHDRTITVPVCISCLKERKDEPLIDTALNTILSVYEG
ncbi:LysR family transcriptional regulator [Seleniivibrio woodruffii]|uniref:LysR family transcriptional regulator n=1 Tax=Seleniivibrio woodruffii TaxID=1078050 RepID=A0A4R1KCF2_9BACT|nr:LysR family transcriptional regulator [Seleniivibrio woodruffii]TCK61827.1 LysR family transcriptional regulator [Seleniivibrio woodruffii]TVZ35058.1 DNA-binding transcriptional LysR family regulator [Seleniivibrio woodruffii]